MILDADLTVLPEELPMFYQALVNNRGPFINGTRLIYPMERDAMRFLNKIANRLFGMLFSWLMDQRIKDTLCGTKVMYKKGLPAHRRKPTLLRRLRPLWGFRPVVWCRQA